MHQSSHTLLVGTSQSLPRVKCKKRLTREKSGEVTLFGKKKNLGTRDTVAILGNYNLLLNRMQKSA